MSWGGSEFSTETNYDAYFTQPGVVYFAASGDSPGVIWPSTLQIPTKSPADSEMMSPGVPK
jgi:hypothetical protein